MTDYRREGFDAFHAGLPKSANPYSRDHPGYAEMRWREGWYYAKAGHAYVPPEPVERYAVVEGSNSAHCCFDASVLDLHAPVYHSEGYWLGTYHAVCECLDTEDAERIASVLNAAE